MSVVINISSICMLHVLLDHAPINIISGIKRTKFGQQVETRSSAVAVSRDSISCAIHSNPSFHNTQQSAIGETSEILSFELWR